MSPHDPLVGTLRDRFSGSLRAVAVGSLDAGCYDIRFERADVSCRDEVFHDLLLESLYTDGQEQLYQAGRLRAVVRLFEDALVVTAFESGGDAGTFVALDADAGVDPTEVVDLCQEHRVPTEPAKSD